MSLASISLNLDPVAPWSAPRIGLPLLVVVAAGIVLLTIASYRGTGVPHRRRAVVLGLRMLALFVTLLTIMRPALAVREDETQPSKLIIAVDASKSMTIADEADNRSRWKAAERLLARCESVLARLRDEHQITVVMHRFSDDLTDFSDLPPTGTRTDFGQTLHTLAQRYGQERALRGVLLLSDGANNGVRYAAQGEAARFRALDCPLNTFALGRQNTSSQLRDVAITHAVAEPAPVPLKGKVTIRARLDAPGLEGSKVLVRVLFGAEQAAAGEFLLTKSADNEVMLEAPAPAVPGEVKMTVRVEPPAADSFPANNEYATYFTVAKEGLSVLIIGRLNWEQKYIRRALSGDKRITVYEAVRQTDDPLRDGLYDFDRQGYDVIIIGDVSARRLAGGRPEILGQIERLVKEKGVGLLMTGGESSFAAGHWRGTPIADALPVRMDASGQVEQITRMQPTTAGKRDYLMRLLPDVGLNEQLWRKLPALPGYTALGQRKPNAVVVGESASGVPLLVRQDYGKGRTAALALDMTYLWQELGQKNRPRTTEGVDAHARFWRQMVLYLAHQEESTGLVWIKPDVRRVPVGAKVDFGVGVRGKTGIDLPASRFDVGVVGPDNQPLPDRVTTAKINGQDRGTFWKTEKPGEYTLTLHAQAQDVDGTSIDDSARARFIVYEDDAELLRPAADHDFLSRLASAGGGQAYLADELPHFLEELPKSRAGDTAAKTYFLPDWRSEKLGVAQPVLFVTFVLLLGIEWGLRRYWGMV